MPLNKQNAPISFSNGIDTKTDKKQVQGKLLSLRNAIFQTGMEIRKRNGFAIITGLNAGLASASYLKELVSLDGTSLFSYDETNSLQINKGTLPATTLDTVAVVRNNNQQTNQDSAINSTLKCFTWTDSTGGIRYSILDSFTNQSIVNNQAVTGTGTVAKVLTIGTKFVIIYIDTSGTTIKYQAIDISTPTTIGSAVTIASDVNSTPAVFDATVINGSIFLAYNNSSPKISLFSLSPTLTLSSQVNFGTDNCNAITIYSDASFNVWVSYAINGTTSIDTKIYSFILNNAMNSTVLGRTQIDSFQVSGTGPAIKNLTASIISTTATIFYEVVQIAIAPGVPLNFIKKNTLTAAGSVGSPSVLMRAVGLASKAFQNAGVIYLLVAYQSNLQPSYFLIRADALNVLKLSPSEGGAYTTYSILPEMNLASAAVFQTASLIKDALTVQNGIISAQTGIISATITFTTVAPSKFVLGQNLHVCGGMMKMYDGGSVVEHGFNVFPEGLYTTWNPDAPIFGGGVGNNALSATINQKQYCLVYEWTDNQGQAHESAPSIPISVILPDVADPTVITGDLNGAGSPPHFGNTILNATGGVVGQYVNLISPTGMVNFGWNAIITGKSGSTLTISPGYNLVATTGSKFLLTNQPLSLYFTATPQPTILAAGFGSVNAVFGQTISPVPTFTSNYPPDTWFQSGAYSTTSGLFDTNNPPNGLGTTQMYFGIDTFTVPLDLPTLKLTDKQNVSLAVYATQINGTTFFRTSSPTALIYNDKTVDYIAFNDTTPDNTLIGNQELYTTGGVVENIGIPATDVSTTFKSRAIAVPSENKLSWWYSKQVIPGLPVEFSDLFVSNIDSRINKITAVYALDDKLIFWGPTSIFYVVGDGPTSSGLNNTFTDAQIITSDVGCTNQASIVLMPLGLMFQSAKGIYLLDRSLAVQYIGADVEAFNNITITSAQLMNSVNQVRFTLQSGGFLVYDYYYKQWDTFTGLTANDSCLFQNQHTIINPSGAISQESPGTFADGSNVINISLQSNWMSFANIQGFQRVYSFLFLGEWKSPHTLTINIYSNFNEATPAQTVTIPYLTQPSVYQYRLFMNEFCAKSESIKIEIIESQTSPGEGLSISSMAFIVGTKQGLFKVPASESYG